MSEKHEFRRGDIVEVIGGQHFGTVGVICDVMRSSSRGLLYSVKREGRYTTNSVVVVRECDVAELRPMQSTPPLPYGAAP